MSCRPCPCRASTTESTPPVRPRRRWRPGADRRRFGAGWSSFVRLPQRLEWFAVVEGRRFYNDSTATTPESTIAALRSLDLPVWLLAGGKSKGFDFEPLAAEIVRRARGAAFFGAAGPELRRRVAAQAAAVSLCRRGNDGRGPALVLAAFAARRGHRAVAGVREHRPVPQFSARAVERFVELVDHLTRNRTML